MNSEEIAAKNMIDQVNLNRIKKAEPSQLIHNEHVKKLVDAAWPCFSDLQKILECTNEELCKACVLEQALKPFRVKEVDHEL